MTDVHALLDALKAPQPVYQLVEVTRTGRVFRAAWLRSTSLHGVVSVADKWQLAKNSILEIRDAHDRVLATKLNGEWK